MVTYDNDCGKDVHARIPAVNQSYQALSKIMKCMCVCIYIYIYI